ncbi:RNA polymerase sigma factor, sigma-70 family [Longilinea arvoryzae]|uniref:RNA polymerase sigma factor, sigma-70 family n=1 Tax=Longilinea arvoryzae TaxID=360412 RepID=A0A0S7BKG3_9CHLR|nr:sigma-70 family RNA polymerase sigma factor [Longilinea arvoryzae]GAP14443.1 RNA polymerase sigma factor, sigma-70 family [Longilinea arvoryzae]
MAEFDEDTVLTRAVEGDKEAFSALYERYVGRIYNYVLYRTGSPTDAEDITARVFQRALRHIDHYHFQGVPFSAWLYRIAHNLVANWHRDNSRRQEVPLEDHIQWFVSGNHPESALENGQEMEGLLKAIRTLSPERQHLIVLKFVEHLSNVDIALIMGKSEGAIKSLYHRTLLALREVLEGKE